MKHVIMLIVFACTIFCCATRETPKADIKTENAKTDTVSLNSAIKDFSAYIVNLLPNNSVTAVAITDAPVQKLGSYIADELTGSLFNGGVRMVSRRDFERISAEQNLQLDARFNDKTTVSITQNLGWKTIIFGTVEPLQETYLLSLRAINVETGEMQGSKSYMLNGRDPVLISMVNPNMTVRKLNEREALLQPFDGNHNNFNLTITTNKNVFYDGEELFITLRSSEDCYFVVYQLDVDNNMQIIYPNFWEKDKNFLKANTAKTIPENTSFLLHAPYGEERILVYASVRPFNISEDQYRPVPVTKELLASPQALWRIESGGGSKGMSVTPRGATGQVNYSVLPRK